MNEPKVKAISPNLLLPPLCEEQFDSKKEILQHRKDVHNKVYQCEVCMDLFIAKEHLTSHVIQVHLEKDETKLHSCEVCGYSTLNLTKLKEHINALHIQKRKYKCNICDFAAKTKDTLNGHMKTHDGFRHFPCEHCGQVLKSARILRNHKCKHTANKFTVFDREFRLFSYFVKSKMM